MLLCLDVHYEEHAANTACVGFENWADADIEREFVVRADLTPQPYQPGSFYKRELPHLLEVVERVRQSVGVEVVLVDGHVWLRDGEPGLGARVHHALGQNIAIVGVAKTLYRGGIAVPVLRGESRQPLFVTAVGMDTGRAAELVRGMHGRHRLPTLIKRADQLARGHEKPDPSKALAT